MQSTNWHKPEIFFKNSYSQELVEIQSINLPREAILRVSNDMQEQDDYISMEFTKFNIPPGSWLPLEEAPPTTIGKSQGWDKSQE